MTFLPERPGMKFMNAIIPTWENMNQRGGVEQRTDFLFKIVGICRGASSSV
jgi:hypothetical protein